MAGGQGVAQWTGKNIVHSLIAGCFLCVSLQTASIGSILCQKLGKKEIKDEKGKEKKMREYWFAFVSWRLELQQISNWLIPQTELVGGNDIMLLVGGWVRSRVGLRRRSTRRRGARIIITVQLEGENSRLYSKHIILLLLLKQFKDKETAL